MEYSKLYGLWVTVKDGAQNAVAIVGGLTVVVLQQVTTQCPDLTITLGTFSVTSLAIKAVLRFISNYEKHKNDY